LTATVNESNAANAIIIVSSDCKEIDLKSYGSDDMSFREKERERERERRKRREN